MATTSATFVLVHGAWSGGWCYHKVAARLFAQGYPVLRRRSPARARRSHLRAGTINLSLHIEDVLNVFHYEFERRRPGRPFLWRHGDHRRRRPHRRSASPRWSISTPSCPRTANRCSTSISPPTPQRFLANAGAIGGLAVPAPPAAFFNVNAEDAARVDALATPFPLGCFTEKIKLTGAHRQIAKRVYVHGTVLPRESPFKPFYERVKADPAWQAHTRWPAATTSCSTSRNALPKLCRACSSGCSTPF